MEETYYTVAAIDGEYAVLREEGGGQAEVTVALFLLPEGTDIGTRLRCRQFSYELAE